MEGKVSRAARVALIVAAVAAVLVLGHFGARALGGASLPMGSLSARVPPPPRAKLLGRIGSPDLPANAQLRYASLAAPAEVARFYRDEMPRNGWTEVLYPPSPSGMEYAGILLAYSNLRGDYCMIAVSQGDADGALVSVVRVRGARRP